VTARRRRTASGALQPGTTLMSVVMTDPNGVKKEDLLDVMRVLFVVMTDPYGVMTDPYDVMTDLFDVTMTVDSYVGTKIAAPVVWMMIADPGVTTIIALGSSDLGVSRHAVMMTTGVRTLLKLTETSSVTTGEMTGAMIVVAMRQDEAATATGEQVLPVEEPSAMIVDLVVTIVVRVAVMTTMEIGGADLLATIVGQLETIVDQLETIVDQLEMTVDQLEMTVGRVAERKAKLMMAGRRW
jgi:hypothetical protein